MTDAFELGYRVGLVCNSDGHKGAPGACYPGASEFGAYSGLTCFIADGLSRDDIFKSMRGRHHYGTTGCRIHLDVVAELGPKGGVYAIDPRIAANEPVSTNTARMGDIARCSGESLDLSVSIEAPSPIERVDILNGADIVQTLRPYEPDPKGRLRVIWRSHDAVARDGEVRSCPH